VGVRVSPGAPKSNILITVDKYMYAIGEIC